jgi:V/A-type H+-transporting ATPase subunit B
LTETDKKFAIFADRYENEFVRQSSSENRTIEETLAKGWELMSILPREELKRLKDDMVEKYMPKSGE